MYRSSEQPPQEYATYTLLEALADHTCHTGVVDLKTAAPAVEVAQAKLMQLGFGEEAIGRAFVNALENIQACRKAQPEDFYA